MYSNTTIIQVFGDPKVSARDPLFENHCFEFEDLRIPLNPS